MPRGQQSKGKCAYCGQEVTKSGVSKHLMACAQWKEAVAKSERKKSRGESLYHLRVQAAGLPEFWLDLEMRGSATLKDLDGYLRAIWLECCGHMSQFSYEAGFGEEISMKRRVDDVLEVGAELTHIYDFGTSSETLVKAVGLREGKPVTSHPIALLVRNVMPECKCMECLIEEEVWGTLCDKHAKTHPHNNYDEPFPLVNSPRLGLCGYDGPAEPPY